MTNRMPIMPVLSPRSDVEVDCVEERGGTWHAVSLLHESTSDFAPIACSTTDEGIVLPGYIERRLPTCPDCMRIGAS